MHGLSHDQEALDIVTLVARMFSVLQCLRITGTETPCGYDFGQCGVGYCLHTHSGCLSLFSILNMAAFLFRTVWTILDLHGGRVHPAMDQETGNRLAKRGKKRIMAEDGTREGQSPTAQMGLVLFTVYLHSLILGFRIGIGTLLFYRA